MHAHFNGHEQRGNLIFSNECHLFLVMIFHIRQEKFYALRFKLPKVRKVESDRQLRLMQTQIYEHPVLSLFSRCLILMRKY